MTTLCLVVVDATFGPLLLLFPMLLGQQFQILVIQRRLRWSRRRFRMGTLFTVVPASYPQEDALQRSQTNFLSAGEGIVTDDQPVSPKPRVHDIEAVLDAHIGELRVDLATLPHVEEFTNFRQVDVPTKTGVFVVARLGRLARLAVRRDVVVAVQPGLVVVVQLSERENRAGTHFGLELVLGRLNDPFNQAPCRRIARRPVQQFNVQMGAGQPQAARMVDFRVVDVQLPAGTLSPPGAKQGVDEDVQVFAEVETALGDIATVAIDPDRQVRLDRAACVDHCRAFGKVPHPQGVALVPCPATADLYFLDAQLSARHSLLAEVAIHGRRGNRTAELLGQEFVDRAWRTARLLAFQFHSAGDHLVPLLAGRAWILAAATTQPGNLLLAKPSNLPPQRRIG